MSGKALAESGDWSTPANNFIKAVIPDPYYTVLKNGFCIAGSILFAGPGVLIGGAINTAVTLGFDLIPDGRIDSNWKDLLNDFGTACMITSLTGPIGKLGNCESIVSKTGMRFLQQMASGTLYDLASGNLSFKNFAQNLVQESISSLVSGRIGNKFWSAATDIALDTGLDAGMQVWDILYEGRDLKTDFDYQRLGQTFVRSLIMNAKYSCDPVDCARGNLFYYKKDISSDDLYGEFLFSRRYDSVLTYEGAFGTGWVHTYETFLTAHDTCKISAVLPDTHMETFVLKEGIKDEPSWENEKGGSQLFTLTHDLEEGSFSLVSREGGNYRRYVYNSNGRLKAMYDGEFAIPYRVSYALEEWLEEEAEAKERGEEVLRRKPDYFELSKITSPGGRTLRFTYEHGRIVSLIDQGKRKVRYEYADNRLVKVHYPSIGIQEYGYDNMGHLLTVKGEDGREFISNTFDKTGRVVKQSYPDGNDCTITYEDEKRQTVFTFSDTGRTERYTYDREKQIIRMEYGDGVEEYYGYDACGNRILETDKNGNTTYRTYNVYGQVIEEKLPDGLVTRYEYNEKNKLVRVTDTNGTRIEYEYDDRLHPVMEKEYLTEETYLTTRKTYDSKGRMLTKTNDLGHTETYVYEDKSIYHPTKWITAEGEVFTYEYDHAGRRKTITSDYGTVEFGYSETGEVNRITDALGNTTRKTIGATGNILKVVPPNAYREYEQEQGFAYRYDYLDRLIESRDPYGSIHALRRDMDGNIIKDIHPNGYDILTHDGPGMEYVYDKRQYKVKEITPAGGIRRYVTDKQGNIVKVIQPEAYEKAIEQAKQAVQEEINGRRDFLQGKSREEHVEERAVEAGEGISYTYDSQNRLQEVMDTEGTVVRRFVYDKKGRLVKDINAEGYTYGDTDEERYGILYQYNQAGWLLEKREPVEIVRTPEITAYASELVSNVNTQMTEPKKGAILYNLTVYEYDLAGNCVVEKHSPEAVSEYGYPTKYHSIYFEYDKRNRLVRVSDSLGAAMEYAYDSLNNRTMEKARINENTYKLTWFVYDKAGRLSQVKAAVDFKDTVEKDNPYMEKAFCITKFNYDKNGNVTEILTPEGYVIKRDYDLLDRITKEEHLDKANGIHRVLSYEYDKAGNLIKQTNTKGDSKEYVYDYRNNLIKQTDEEGNVTRYFYDKNNSLIKAVSPDNYREELDDGTGTTFTYDAFGRMESVRNALGYLEEYNQYNKAGQLIRKGDETGTLVEYQYDIGGRIQSITTGEVMKARESAKTEYFDKRNPTSTNSTSPSISQVLQNNPVSQSFTYDARGNITGIRDGEGNRTLYQLDDWGRIESLHKPDGSEEHYTYDYAGNITTTTDGKGGIITYRYNSFNQLGEILDQTGEKERFFYDKQGRLAKQIDRNQNSIVYKLNIDNQLVYKKEEKSGLIYGYQYNTEGQLTEATGGGVQYQYDYTPSGSVKTKYVNHKLALQYSYTKSGNVAGILDATGKKTEYAYDEANRVAKVMDNGKLLVTYGYHVDNTLAQARFANGITAEYTYDKDKNPASITTTTKTGEKLFAYRYAYDYNGNRILKQDMRELSVGDLQGVGDYGRIGETGGQAPISQATTYTYDPLQRIAGVSYADGKEERFAYDSAGNRALRKYGNIEEAYQYDSRNRLTELIRKDSTRAENNRITLYQYDNQGNTLLEETRGYTTSQMVFNPSNSMPESGFLSNKEGKESLLQTSHYEYDGFNKTRKVTVEYFGNEKETPTAVQTQENFYDAENLRYGIAENGERTNFITNGWKVLSEQDESNQTTNRIVLGYGIIASDSLKQEGDGYRYFHWNEHGDTEYITGEDGQVLNRYGYDAFGSLTTAEEIVRNRYTYNGEQYDAITSQYYLRARFYNPQVARFTQEDVYRGDGLNLYAYCANNPVMYLDPSGYGAVTYRDRNIEINGENIGSANYRTGEYLKITIKSSVTKDLTNIGGVPKVNNDFIAKEFNNKKHTDRGKNIENIIAEAGKNQYIQIGEGFNGKFPVIDLANETCVISVKSMNVYCSTYTKIDANGKRVVDINAVTDQLAKYYNDIENIKITINGESVDKILDIELNTGKNGQKLKDEIEQELRKKTTGKCKINI
ncbi:hypothetical protein acsn021_30850 [Anaerocolumna cellulosilytica]|uniref:Type IV secretion protein Rhs n=3 Tax=Anaerocolumna cellulosilytica TaxID=433286 RepID=A0A6S6R0E4_9FIRM|nr:RHS repeat-associated core domain-containing protein [Anaerocolumna cellulosilytica]BCJ95516.1 hypothetical protein acsn021_30850 [Anaerocolumna cellulosilytica]